MPSPPVHPRGCFVAGTDTGVGKTRAAAGLLALLAEGGARCAGLKPVASGLEPDPDKGDGDSGGWINQDVAALRAASSLPLTDAEVGPCQLRTACAPHLAAALEGRSIDRAALNAAALALAARCDWLVVEGVGGVRVPLGADWDTADLALDLGLPVILVVGLRLGCISHALLSAEALQARGLRLAGWIGTTVDPSMPLLEENIATLSDWLGSRHRAPCLGVVPWLADPCPAAVATHLDAAALRRALISGESNP